MPDEIIEQTAQPEPSAPEPTAAPAEAQPQEAQAQEQDQQQQHEDSGDKPRDDKGRFKGVQSRIDELTRARYEAEREAAYWRGRAGGDLSQDQAQPSAAPAVAPKPTPDKFQDYAEYVEALADWKAEEKVSAALRARDQSAQQQKTVDTWTQRQEAARKSMPDYDAVMSNAPDTPVPAHVGQSILESDVGPAIAYHFAKNPAELERVTALPPLAAAREIGKLEARFAQPSAAAAPAAKPLSNAPPPIKPINGGNSTSTNPATMSMDQYVAMRAKQGARWAK